MKRYKWIAAIVVLLMLTPLLVWFIQKERTLNVILFDYTVGKTTAGTCRNDVAVESFED